MTLRDHYVREMEQGLHDLCQPVTSLQCRLELGKMANDEASLRETVDESLMETRRIFAAIAGIRERLLGCPNDEAETNEQPG